MTDILLSALTAKEQAAHDTLKGVAKHETWPPPRLLRVELSTVERLVQENARLLTNLNGVKDRPTLLAEYGRVCYEAGCHDKERQFRAADDASGELRDILQTTAPTWRAIVTSARELRSLKERVEQEAADWRTRHDQIIQEASTIYEWALDENNKLRTRCRELTQALQDADDIVSGAVAEVVAVERQYGHEVTVPPTGPRTAARKALLAQPWVQELLKAVGDAQD